MKPNGDHSLGSGVRARILAAAEALIARAGIEAATTRAVASEAGVQAPTIYRIFGGKDGLLDAVAETALASYVADKAERARAFDSVEEMRAGWDRHVDFALAHPGIFAIMAARPDASRETSAMRGGLDILRAKIEAVAAAGRLRMPVQRALSIFHGAATGIIWALLRQPPEARDMAVSHEAREAAIDAITGGTTEQIASGLQGAAAALRARLSEVGGLSAGETLLLAELLDKIAGGR